MSTEEIQTINDIARLVHENAKEHGFHGFHEDTHEFITRSVANAHGEVSEFWEAHRNHKLNSPCDKADKMMEPLTCGEEELADIVIRALDTAMRLEINIGRAISVKHEFNVRREHRHGGKAA